ncbi:MAG: PfkB family carbohydrate kinase [Muribaculum sp.]|nr:PfkB family carbohydrate kinase [Muribaculaceae bacterium]MCM1080232.1 PfkB family carbohydrate kinase [Muribaculum sp.]
MNTESTRLSPVGPQEHRKTIVIGECFLEIGFRQSQPVGSRAGGYLLRAACKAAQKGVPVTFVGETARDCAGQIIVGQLASAGVDTRSIDLFTEGSSATHLTFDTPEQTIAYGTYPQEEMSVVWPRIDADDVVVYGGAYVVDQRVRPQVNDILRYARDRRAMIIYVPAFSPWLAHRITRHMPAILENLESADMTIALPTDLKMLFGQATAERAFSERVRFHADRMLSVGSETLEMFGLQNMHASAPVGNSDIPAALAAVIETLVNSEINHETIAMADNDAMSAFVNDIALHI